MKKVFFCLLLPFFLTLISAEIACVSAAQLQTIDNVAKQIPPRGSIGNQHQTAVRDSQPVVLGEHRNIAHIKARPGAARTASVGWLPDVSRKISAKSAVIIDAGTGEVMYELAGDTPRQPASTIKILTAMIALKSLDAADWVKVSNHAAGMPRSKIYLDPQKSYRAEDLINAVLLASANDASVALAEKIAGSEKDFAEMMTLRASLWGAKNTVCRTSSGLTAKGQQSTARDLAMIFRHAMQDEDFAARMGKTKARTSYGKMLRSHNKALWSIEGAEGGKTGYTQAARQTYVGQFGQGEDKIIVAIMGSETMWADVEQLVKYGYTRQKQQHFASKERQLDERVAMAED